MPTPAARRLRGPPLGSNRSRFSPARDVRALSRVAVAARPVPAAVAHPAHRFDAEVGVAHRAVPWSASWWGSGRSYEWSERGADRHHRLLDDPEHRRPPPRVSPTPYFGRGSSCAIAAPPHPVSTSDDGARPK